jgi:UDP-glucose 4-epimerase
MSLKNKVVAVTGGAGFVGSHLVDSLINEEPEEILVIDNYFLGLNSNLKNVLSQSNSVRVAPLNLACWNEVAHIFEETTIDIVFDLATVPLPFSLKCPVEAYLMNIDMGITVAELARLDLFKTLVHFSTSEVYGTCVKSPMDESHPLNGRTTYAASKAAVDQLLLSYYHTFGIDVSIIRPFNIYGPRQNAGSYAAVIPITIHRLLEGKRPVICGDGLQTRDYTYVTDITNAAIKFYNKKNTRGRYINVASGKELSVIDLVLKICRIMKHKDGLEFRPERLGDVRKHIADISCAKACIGYNPEVTLETGIAKTVEWYTNPENKT